MKTGNRKPLGAWLTAGLLFIPAVIGMVSAASAPAPAEGPAVVERSPQFVLDEDLDVKIFVHQNRPV
ncbi:hypothetical protein [Zoogloea sp.]|uniref:hypothetical protein n=1 Tax=Zoogloea sp. TaxID=49181 RepID=UPI0014160825|nr:MAG: hypothetical protein F9K15_13030 [Zoogloea sp.]